MITLITHEQFETMLQELQPDTATAANAFISLYGAATSEKKRWEQQAAKAKEMIAEIIIETGETRLTTKSGIASIIKPSLRIEYDWKKLDELCADNNELANLLLPHRKVTEVAGSLRIDPRMRK